MNKLKSFLITSVIGGLVVILPATITFMVFKWIFSFILDVIKPITEILQKHTDMGSQLSSLIAISSTLTICFLIGNVVRTRLGKFIFDSIEKRILGYAPGYSLIKETVLQFIGKKESPFSKVALANIFGNDTMVTAFVTEIHDNDMFTVFVPTGPNPTSGNIYHLKSEYVHLVDASVENTMRSIISCGAGSGTILQGLSGKNV